MPPNSIGGKYTLCLRIGYHIDRVCRNSGNSLLGLNMLLTDYIQALNTAFIKGQN